jgi:glycine/D-amino acid oxidase-like deaminating enzyme
MLDAELDTDVLIVGAGPVGLFLANECARRGLMWRIDDAGPAVTRAAGQLAEAFNDVVELRPGAVRNITLVRPDGYVAYAARNGGGLAALKSVRSILELQTNKA